MTTNISFEGIKGIEENLKFLTLETAKQIIEVGKILDCAENCEKLIEKVESKDDYIDNMKNVIESKSNSFLAGNETRNKTVVGYTRAATVIGGNLEHIADHAVNIVRQVRHLKDKEFIKGYDYAKCIDAVYSSISMVPKALEKRSINTALKICRAETEIDAVYGATIKRVIEELKEGKSPENLITTLFIFQYLERMGDCLLNIGESIISIALGERIKIHQYAAVNEAIGMSENGIVMEGVGETRSGTTIRKVYDGGKGESARWVIFKDGSPEKLRKEKENMEMWEKISPGLVPKVIAFNENAKSCSMVVEYIKGMTYKDMIVNAKPVLLKKAMTALAVNTRNLWVKTMEKKISRGNYLGQLNERLNDVYAVHPEFKRTGGISINGLEVPSFEQMVKIVSEKDRQTPAPFSVMIHGDCNADNILYEQDTGKIHYIDLHRSRRADYVQDVSVFLVSCFRLPLFEARIRENIEFVIKEYMSLAYSFASEMNDTTFDFRLALGLIRSFTTSTRFELNEQFASVMFMKAVYLMEKIITNTDGPDKFRLPSEILDY